MKSYILSKRVLAFVVAFVMVLGLMPVVPVYAEDPAPPFAEDTLLGLEEANITGANGTDTGLIITHASVEESDNNTDVYYIAQANNKADINFDFGEGAVVNWVSEKGTGAAGTKMSGSLTNGNGTITGIKDADVITFTRGTEGDLKGHKVFFAAVAGLTMTATGPEGSGTVTWTLSEFNNKNKEKSSTLTLNAEDEAIFRRLYDIAGRGGASEGHEGQKPGKGDKMALTIAAAEGYYIKSVKETVGGTVKEVFGYSKAEGIGTYTYETIMAGEYVINMDNSLEYIVEVEFAEGTPSSEATLVLSDNGDSAEVYDIESVPATLKVNSTATTTQKQAKTILTMVEPYDEHTTFKIVTVGTTITNKTQYNAANGIIGSTNVVPTTGAATHKIVSLAEDGMTIESYEIVMDLTSVAEVKASTNDLGKKLTVTTNHDTKTYTITGIPYGTLVSALIGTDSAWGTALTKTGEATGKIFPSNIAQSITNVGAFNETFATAKRADGDPIKDTDVLAVLAEDGGTIVKYNLSVVAPSTDATLKLKAQGDANFIPGLTLTTSGINNVPYYITGETRTKVSDVVNAVEKSAGIKASLKAFTSSVANVAAFSNELNPNLIAELNTPVETGYVIAVLAEDGKTLKNYTITVLEAPPELLAVNLAPLSTPVEGKLTLSIETLTEGSNTKAYYRIVDVLPTALKLDSKITTSQWTLYTTTASVTINVAKDKYVEAVEVDLSNNVKKWGVSGLTPSGLDGSKSSLTAVTPKTFGTGYIAGLAVNETAKEITGIPYGKSGDDLAGESGALVASAYSILAVVTDPVATSLKNTPAADKEAMFGAITNADSGSSKTSAGPFASSPLNVRDGDVLIVQAQDKTTYAYYTLKVIQGSDDNSVSSKNTIASLTVGTNAITGVPANTLGTGLTAALNKHTNANMKVVTALSAAGIYDADTYNNKSAKEGNVATTDVLVVVSQTGKIAKYALSLLPTGAVVSVKANATIKVGDISSNKADITNTLSAMTVSELLASLDKAADASWIVVANADAETITTAAMFDLVSKGSKAKAGTATVVNKDVLVVKAANDTLNYYTIRISGTAKLELQELIAKAESDFNNQEDFYTEVNWNKFDAALKAAKAVINKTSSTEQEFIKAYNDLDAAMKALDISDKLTRLIEVADEYLPNENNYETDTWVVFEDALQDAKDIVNVTAPKDVLNVVYNDLYAAINGLKLTSTAARTRLEDLIAACKTTYDGSNARYTTESWAVFAAAYEAALAALDEESTEASVFNALIEELEDAHESLETYADVLQDLIDSLAEYESELYTEESWQAALDAAEYAQLIINGNGSVTVVKNAITALQKAIDGLELIEEVIELDTEAIDAAITKAEAALKDITIAEDAKEVAKGEAFWSQADFNKLSDAIAVAKKAKTDAKEQKDIDDAVSALESAIATFEAAKKIGTYEDLVAPRVVDISLTGGETWKQLGENVNITVNATGSGPLSYIWYYIDEAGVMVTLDDQTGATLTNTTKATGLYAYGVVVLNEAGQAWSDHVWVYVWQCTTPEITVPPTAGHPAVSWLEQGQGFNLSVTATGGEPMYYIWYYIHESEPGNLVVFGDTASLTATPSQSGVYAYGVVVINPAGVVWSDLVWVYVYNNVAPANMMFDSMMFDDVVVDEVVVDEVVVEDVVVDDVVVDTVMPE